MQHILEPSSVYPEGWFWPVFKTLQMYPLTSVAYYENAAENAIWHITVTCSFFQKKSDQANLKQNGKRYFSYKS